VDLKNLYFKIILSKLFEGGRQLENLRIIEARRISDFIQVF